MKKHMNRIITMLMAMSIIIASVIPVSAKTKVEDSNQKTVRVAMLNYPNFINYGQNGNPSGFACDYLNEIAKYTGWNYEYIPVSFSDAQKMLVAGELDIVPGTQYTDDRAKSYNYCDVSMLQDSNVLCVPADDTTYYYNDFKELEGKNIGVMTGSIRKEQFQEVLNIEGVSVQFIEFDTNDEEIAALSDGRVSAILMSMIRCTPDYRIIGSTNPTDVYFTTNPNDSSIKDGIDQAQEEILSMDPYYGLKLAQKFYGSVPRAYAFSDEEREFIDNCPVISVAVAKDSSPIEYYDTETCSFKGLVIDYFDKISQITGIKFQYVARGDKNNTIQAMNAGTLQILATATNGVNLEDTYPVTLTDSYIQNSVSLVYNDEMEDPLNKDCRIALKSGFVYFHNLADEQGYRDIITFDTFSECVDAVSKGKADATYLPMYSVGGIVGHEYFRHLKVFSSEIANYDCSIGVSNLCDPMLVSILDKSLASIPTADKESMVLKAMSNNTEKKTIKDVFYENLTTILFMIVILCTLVGIFGIILASRRKKTNQKLSEAMYEVERADAAKTDFMSRMSHDMRTPMNGILGISELSKEETDITVLKENMNKIRQSGQYLLCLINDTLDFQKMESERLKLEPQIVLTKDIIANVMMMIKMDAKKKNVDVQMVTENVDMNDHVKVDQVRIKQIFFNILSNAVKFTPAGGSVKICIKRNGFTGNVSHNIITISDTGIGMSKDFIENGIFKPFSQEHSSIVTNYSGSGLGLSIAKKLVELMNGRISVKSELGEGTTFTVEMDFEHADESEVDNVISQNETDQRKIENILAGKHILLAEDHPLNAEIATKLLKKAGCEVEWTDDGKKCLECFKTSSENYFDTILMDIRMPIMDGITSAKMIRQLERADAKTIPIIAVTANAYESDIQNCLNAGMNAHLAKPIDPEKMYEIIAYNLMKQ